MTITQLEYIVAVDTHRHFMVAAEKCFVTQPTLSMQIQKLEDELGIKLFDRTKKPVIPTEIGEQIIAQARNVIRDVSLIQQIVDEQKDITSGELRIGIIPTLAPYLLPLLYPRMQEKYPQLHLRIKESITRDIINDLKNNRLDCALVVTPLQETSIKEDVLFYEEMFVYVSANHALANKRFVVPNDIHPDKLWLLEEGHCFRSQVLNLCELKHNNELHFSYQTGNIESLKRMVDKSDGLTIMPELAIAEFNDEQRRRVKKIQQPRPVREVSLVTHRDHIKTKLIQSLRNEIVEIIPKHMRQVQQKRVVSIDGIHI